MEFSPRYNFAFITVMTSADTVIVTCNRKHVQYISSNLKH